MFVNLKEDMKVGEKVSVLGKVSKRDQGIIYIQTDKAEIPVKYKNIENYTQDYLIVSGMVDGQRCIVEENIDIIDKEFDYTLFCEFVTVGKKFAEIF